MKKKNLIPVALSAVFALSLMAGCGGGNNNQGAGAWNNVSGKLSAKLTDFGFEQMTDLTVGDFVKSGAVELNQNETEVVLSTSARTVSHGNIYTAFVTAPVYGSIKKGDTIVIRAAIKNEGEGQTNFLVDLYGKDETQKRMKSSWLTRNVIINPEKEYTDYYFYGVAEEDTDEAEVEINLGYAAQNISVDFLQAAKYSGTIKETIMEKLPLMSRNNKQGKNHWHLFYDPNASWRTKAATMVEENRKGDIQVNVKDASGNAVSGAEVTVEMTGHTYKFGTSGGANTSTDYFNHVTIGNGLKWGDRGFAAVGAQESQLNAARQIGENGQSLHGHVLFWGANGRDPYDDGIENTAEFETSPPFVGGTAYVLERMQRMRGKTGFEGMDGDPILQGYGGTIKDLKDAIEKAYTDYEWDLSTKRNADDFTKGQIATLKAKVDAIGEKIKDLPDTDTTYDGLNADIADLQVALRKAILDHIEQFATYYGQAGSITEWDVINEAMNEGNRGVTAALDEDTYFYTRSNVCQDQIYVDMFKAARKGAGENVKLGYNDTSWQGNGQQRTDTYNFFKYLHDNDAPIDYFGLQAYMYPQSIQAHVAPEEMWAEFDKMYALGIETEVTEYALSGWNDVFDTTTQLNQLQADFTYDTLLAHFAHESSFGFIGWGGLASSGPVASAWYKVAYNEWWTNEIASTVNGSATVNGFLGDYKITVKTADGKEKSVTVNHANSHKKGNKTVVDITV